jgi:hypothetical protein
MAMGIAATTDASFQETTAGRRHMRVMIALICLLSIALTGAACRPSTPVTSFSPATGSDGGGGGGGGGSM